MTTQPFRAKAEDDAPSPWQLLATGEQTGGMLLFGEARMPPRSNGPSFHVHEREDESVYVIEGVLTVAIGDEVVEVTAGEFMWLPRGVPHTFANRSEGWTRAVGAIVPSGLEKMFAEQEEYFASLDGPPDPARIAEIGARYGVTQLGPPLDVEG